MRDQAEALRMKMLKAQGELAKSIAIVSGKGGVGKSNFSTNFAHSLRLKGKKVIVIDMDIGMGNIHILLGVSPKYSLRDYLMGSNSLEDVINVDEEGLTFISGGSGLDTVLEWSESMFERLLDAFEHLQKEYDFILFDMGAGATQRSIELIMSVDEVIVISTTEPTSITDAYSMMKFICLKDPDKKFNIVSNRVTKQDDGNESATRLQYAMRKFLDKETLILGFLPEDPTVHKAVLAQKPFSLLYPNAPVSKRMAAIADVFVQVDRTEIKQEIGFLTKLRGIFLRGRE
ncbi:flagellum site-determining protein YlxH [Sporosarcina luteola]|uniref:Flagellum site-determining protein YlxH n=1 Tax=Sporosarcina luteola TaxID=582850 RepID=A0A511Z3J4_9BACL|nr:MinD/ParA family protein [Sporosarcina luteola]GEN82009.1 flagellum site-determining protein YlxH [Sporosarcina luteola]